MSSAPVGTSSPVICLSDCAMRRASGTPRLRMPTSATSSTPRLRSTISWAMRVSAREMRSASMTTAMAPLDVRARVISNVRLSDDYNVLTLAAPAIGERTEPGQFVMVKAEGCTESLLRRPFSVFEIVRDEGRPVAISILNKRAGRNTNVLYQLESGQHVVCLGPLGKPFTPTADREAWMVAGGVGLAPFATLAESLARARIDTTLFYGARSANELFYLSDFEKLGVTLVLATEDGTRGTR